MRKLKCMVPCLHQRNTYIRWKIRVWREQKSIALVGGETPLACAGRETTLSRRGLYWSENGNLRKLGWNYCLKLQVWRQQKYIPLVGAETLLTCAGRQATPSHGGRYRAENGNLHKLGWTYRHGTVFATKKYAYPKEVWVWREQKCISLVGGETPITCVGRQTTPSHVGRYRAENGHLHTLG